MICFTAAGGAAGRRIILMKIINAKVFTGHSFTDGGIEFDQKILDVEAHVTGSPADEAAGDVLDAQGCLLIPGLVDVHTHAAIGADASDGDPQGLQALGVYYAAEGVTSWCPTTMTLKEPQLTKAMEAIRAYQRPDKGAKAVGIHLEGPFVSYEKRGAQNPDNIHVPDAAMFHRLDEASGGMVRLITMAPETPGAIDCIRDISKTCTVSVGHTAADYDTAMAAFEAGASHITHVYNALNGLHHRAPGPIAAAFDSGATVELIPDGFHVHPAMIRLTHRIFGDNLVLVSDSLRCAGMPDGEYELGGQPITMKNSKATLTGTDTLAGSSIHLMEGLRRAVSFGIRLEDAVYAATAAPARAIRMDDQIGSLEKGKCADLVLLDSDLRVRAVYVDGKKI